jgi:hypothetical protein
VTAGEKYRGSFIGTGIYCHMPLDLRLKDGVRGYLNNLSL